MLARKTIGTQQAHTRTHTTRRDADSSRKVRGRRRKVSQGKGRPRKVGKGTRRKVRRVRFRRIRSDTCSNHAAGTQENPAEIVGAIFALLDETDPDLSTELRRRDEIPNLNPSQLRQVMRICEKEDCRHKILWCSYPTFDEGLKQLVGTGIIC